MKYTHVLQGYATGIGWCDMNACKTEKEALAHMQAALNTPETFMPGTRSPKDCLRVVPVSQANCRYDG